MVIPFVDETPRAIWHQGQYSGFHQALCLDESDDYRTDNYIGYLWFCQERVCKIRVILAVLFTVMFGVGEQDI